jgi:Flp pilus assembly protein TadD
MSMQWRRRTILTAIVMLLLGTGLPATILADGGGGGDERANLPRGKPEDPDYAAGVRAIKANRFAEAIPMLQRVVERDSQNADAYNWLAYATRRNGDAAAALPLYEKALAINPKHRGAHEYMGEAYLVLGNLAGLAVHARLLGVSRPQARRRAVREDRQGLGDALSHRLS